MIQHLQISNNFPPCYFNSNWNDISNNWEFSVFNGKQICNLPENSHAITKIIKPDHTKMEFPVSVIDNKIIIDLNSHKDVVNVGGDIRGQIDIYDSNGNLIYSPHYTVFIEYFYKRGQE